MNNIDTTQASDPNKRQPFSVKSLKFLQDATKEIFNAAAAALIGDSISGAIGYIFYSGRMTGTVIASAYVYFGGEWYEMTGDDTAGYSNVPVIVADTTNDATIDPITFTDSSTGSVHKIRKLKVVDQVSGTGLFDYSAAVFVQDTTVRANTQMLIKVIDIGDWNMDSTNIKSVAHGLTAGNIRDVRVVIRNDAASAFSDLNIPESSSASTYPEHEGIFSWDSTNVIMTRRTGGYFDATSHDQTSYNRGWITIHYVA